MQGDETSIKRGQTAQWNIEVWAEKSNVSNTQLKLTAAPSSLSPKFTFGGKKDGSATNSLETVDSGSTKTELQAQVKVPSTATSVDSVKLTVTGSGTDISKGPVAAVSIKVTAAATASAGTTGASAGTSTSTTPSVAALPATSLPYLSTTGTSALGAPGLSSLSPGGNASGLFPTLNPADSGNGQGTEKARAMSDTTALPGDASVAGAQFAGLGALALASILAVTRLSVRRRSTTGKPSANGRQ
ncbi:MAG TPA: hypothetical protein VGG75_42325 [Trebonia sp.]